MYFSANDKLPFVYFEMGNVNVQEASLVYSNKNESYIVPAGRFNTMFLGPGITITHSAVKFCMQTECLLVWVGQDITKCYGTLPAHNRSSKNLIHQTYLFYKKKNLLLKRYYEMRFGKSLISIGKPSAEKIRGIEGNFMKKVYIENAKKYGIPYSGRMKAGEWDKNTIYNKAISISNSLLYGMSCSVIIAMGYLPCFGILHKGDTLSLVFDIADLYKHKFSIPLGFEFAKEFAKTDIDKIEPEIRRKALSRIKDMKLIEQMIDDIEKLFDGCISDKELEKFD